MKLRATLFTAALVIASHASQAEDLAYIYQQAVNNDHEFRAAEAAFNASKEGKALGRSSLLPKINAEASLSENTSITNSETSKNQRSISLSQSLFNLGDWHNYKSSVERVNAAEANFKTQQQQLILRVAQAYFDTLQAAANLETSLAQEKALEHQLEQAKQRFNVGLNAITEVHEAQASYDSAVADRLINSGALMTSFDALEVLTGEPYKGLAPLKTDFPVVPPQPAARIDWVKRASENNHALEAAKFNFNASERNAKSKKYAHMPTLSLSGNYSKSNSTNYSDRSIDINTGLAANAGTPADQIGIERFRSDPAGDGHNISVTLSVPIFNGGSTSASRRQAKQQAIQAKEQLLKLKRDTVQKARSSHLSVITTVATVKARKQAILSSESALEATQAGYSVGTRNLVDVLNAQRSLYRTKREYYSALYSYVLNTLKLKAVAGMLSANDLQQLNNWLDSTKVVRAE